MRLEMHAHDSVLRGRSIISCMLNLRSLSKVWPIYKISSLTELRRDDTPSWMVK